MIAPATGFFSPKTYFLIAGTGDASSALVAFDRALLSVGLGNVNLVRLSSILSPSLTKARPTEIQTGAFVGAAYASISSHRVGSLIAAAVAVARPMEKDRESIIMEQAGLFSGKVAEDKATEMAIAALMSRDLRVRDIETVCTEHVIKVVGCAFAAVIQL